MDFNKDVIIRSNTVPVLVDFSASWCGPCRMIKPLLTQINNDRKDLDVIIIDVDKERALAQQFQIRSVPSMFLFVKGKNMGRYQGGFSPKMINDWVDQLSEEPLPSETN